MGTLIAFPLCTCEANDTGLPASPHTGPVVEAKRRLTGEPLPRTLLATAGLSATAALPAGCVAGEGAAFHQYLLWETEHECRQ